VAAALSLVLYAPLLAGAGVLVWRRPALALAFFVVGLALHNAAMAALYSTGVEGAALTAIQAWKEALLAVALARVFLDAVRGRTLPFRPGLVDAFALAFGVLAVVYAMLPQSVLGGGAGAEAVLLGLRHALLPVLAYLLGRSLLLGAPDLHRLGSLVLVAAAAVAALGLLEEYTLSVEWWRDSGAPGYFREQLGFDYRGPARMPENFAFNTEDGLFRRLISVFLSPLATSYMLVVALLLAAAAGALGRRVGVLLALLCAVGLLFTLSRSAVVALAAGLVLLALIRRRLLYGAAALAALVAGVAFAFAFPAIAPETHFLPTEIAEQERIARELGGLPDARGAALDLDDPSLRSHLSSLREGLETVVEHPQGYGLGNAGAVARRTDTRLIAGESNFAEVGAELGALGLVLFGAWNITLLWTLARRARSEDDSSVRAVAAGAAAALGAVLALAIQTDAYGVPWLAFCLWGLAGALARPSPAPLPFSGMAIDSRVDIGHVHLKVAEIDRALAFYRDVLGFEVMQHLGDSAAFISAGGYHHHLGLNTWESRGGSPPPPGTTGLYHVAIRYPDRRTLGDALRRLVDAGIPLDGATDHGVSEALYLRDPDGNGVELYRDRPSEEWPRAQDGQSVAMFNAPLDLPALLAEAAGSH